MELDEMLKQATSEETVITTTEPVITIGNEEKKGNIYLDETNDIRFDNSYECSLLDDLRLLEEVKARIEAKKEEIKAFIETNNKGSFRTELLNIKYSSATTTTTIDTTRLKKEMPEIAAKYSKVGTRKSSISIELKEADTLTSDINNA